MDEQDDEARNMMALSQLCATHTESLYRYLHSAFDIAGSDGNKVRIVVSGVTVDDLVLFLPLPRHNGEVRFAAFEYNSNTEMHLNAESVASAQELVAPGGELRWIVGKVIAMQELPGNPSSSLRRYTVFAEVVHVHPMRR